MQIVNVLQAGVNDTYKWPSGNVESYHAWIEYQVQADDGKHLVRIGYGKRSVYGQERVRVVVWIDGDPHVEFFGADDFAASGTILSEIRIRQGESEVMCRYPSDAIPDRYAAFAITGLPTQVQAKGVRNAWAIITTVADHKTLIAFAALRRIERR